MVLPFHKTSEKPIDDKKIPFVIKEPNSKKQIIWYHWFNVRFCQYMILEILLIINLILIFSRLQTISNQNNQVMVSSMKSQMSILERKLVSGKLIENTKPLEQAIFDVLKNMEMEPTDYLKPSKTEELITPPPLNLSNNIFTINNHQILCVSDYLRGASVDNAHSSSSNLNPIIGYDQTNLVLLDRPQPPTHKAWCSNEHNPVLTINLAKYIKPISVSYQHSKWTHHIPNSAPRTYDVVACHDFYCQNWKPLVSNCEYSSQSSGTEQFCNISSHLNVPIIGKVQFRFKENYGDSQMTCAHLVRVYGETDKPVEIQKTKNLESQEICTDLKWYYENSYIKYNWVKKNCSILYENDCCSDCPECCDECLISDYNWETCVLTVLVTIVGFAYLLIFAIIIAMCCVCLTGNTGCSFLNYWDALLFS
ncbi:hypothetical protein B9Z55_000322 [Caenorhabditis nigoni]|uniref:SUN domain-containing protein n=1 Tax=Caenorhabditis nigoni TaxID=1611254 RepID=A0A2G5VPI1_9PELO|nr:hypothetical protein B9Z55_000322 [Caenorhabditis nigoni]